MKAKHTQTPWTISKDRTILTILEKSHFVPIAFMNEQVFCYENNAKHIVKCVNMYDELVEALEQAKNYITGDYIDADGLVEQLESVLNKAKGE